MLSKHRPTYRATQVFYTSVVAFTLVIFVFGAALGYGIWLPRYKEALDQSRSRLTAMLAESVSDDVRRGNLMLAQTRLSRAAGIDGVLSATLFELEIPNRDHTEYAVYHGTVVSGDREGRPLATLNVAFSRQEERLANRTIVILISSFSGIALLLFAGIGLIGRVLLVKPLVTAARQVRESGPVQRIEVAKWIPKEILDLVAAHNQRIEEINALNEENTQLVQTAAIARMTQMFAHDVRKPFSILRMGLAMLGNAKDPESVKRVLGRLLPEIDKAVGSVDGLISDVMEVGSTSTKLIQEPISPKTLIDTALGETFRIYPKAQIAIAYDFNHTHLVNVHVQKLGRVLSNIIGNAIQAMLQNGDLWFRTREHEGMTLFCLGNSGSFILPEHLPKLFDAFFTSGKKGGTGLGLAIAQKIVTAHGGRIWCESTRTATYPDGQVEFFFTLPVAAGHVCGSAATLPSHSSDITQALTAAMQKEAAASFDKGELGLEAELVQTSARLGRPVQVLIVDDEAVYRSAIATYLSRTDELKNAVHVVMATDSELGKNATDRQAPDLIITDVDLGPNSDNGFDLVRHFRKNAIASLICIHSNRIVAADHKEASEAGADAFLPKPMARAQLLRLLLQATAKPASSANPPDVTPPLISNSLKPEILVIDDDPFILEAWEQTLTNDAKVHLMSDIETLRKRVADDPEFLAKLDCVVTDMYLDGSVGNGLAIGHLVKSKRTELPVLLSTDAWLPPTELIGKIDAVIGKAPVTLSALKQKQAWKHVSK